jgi:hypothetical protein
MANRSVPQEPPEDPAIVSQGDISPTQRWPNPGIDEEKETIVWFIGTRRRWGV